MDDYREVKETDQDGINWSVDYNYEPLILETFSYNKNDKNVIYDLNNNNGTVEADFQKICNFISEKYGIDFNYQSDDFFLFDNYGVFSDNGFNLYKMDGSLYKSNVGSHAMTKTGETKDGKWIVSSWGEKLIYEPNKTSKY